MVIRELFVIAEDPPRLEPEPDGTYALNLGDDASLVTISLTPSQLERLRDDAAALLLIAPVPLGLIEAAG